MPIRIIAVGKRHESWVNEGIERYQKRLRKPLDVEWILLPHSPRDGQEARQEESERVLSRLSDRDFVLLLDETGEKIDSHSLSSLLEAETQAINIVIGGAYGVSNQLKQRADKVISLSSLTFPHQLVRLILIEQLYRAQTIAAGLPYHHD